MSSILLTAPVVEPLTLAEAKAFLRVEHGDDDAPITALVAAARAHVEAQTRRALIDQTWRLVRDAWPDDGRIAVLPEPLREVTAARVYDAAGVAHTVSPSAFIVDTAGAALSFMPGTLTLPGRASAGIEIDIVAGYGAAASNVPEPLRQAIRLLVAHWYENRAVTPVGQGTITQPVAALLAPYRVLGL
jgi:uncharacterized phiE125 gp8 family phage protein